MRKRILAIDYGERRIGLALSDPSNILATPFTTLDTRIIKSPVEQIAVIAEENEVDTIVVGYPIHLDGRKSEKALAVDLFVENLKKRMPHITFDLTDERYSSVEAGKMLKTKKRKKRFDKQAIDRYAAAVFLQEYLNEHSGK